MSRGYSLITRVKTSFSVVDLLQGLFASNSGSAKQKCLSFLCDFYNGESVCLTPSARDAIYELLMRLPQKKVVVPAYTCIVVVEAVKLAGKEIVYAPTEKGSFNSSYLECITADSIVLATHQYGLPCNIKAIAKKCQEVGSVLIEDCATSMGTTVDGQMTGTFGDYAVVSFNASKMLTVPPCGGLLIGKNRQMIEEIERNADWKDCDWKFKMRGLIRGFVFLLTENHMFYKFFHWWSIDRKGKIQRTEHEKPSEIKTDLYKYRFAEWQAVILWKQLQQLDKIMARRKEIYAYYDKYINNPLLKKPIHNPYAVCCRYAVLAENRYTFYKACVSKGVDMDFSHCTLGCPESFEYDHKIAKEVLNLPFYYHMSDKEMKKVVSVVNSIKL